VLYLVEFSSLSPSTFKDCHISSLDWKSSKPVEYIPKRDASVQPTAVECDRIPSGMDTAEGVASLMARLNCAGVTGSSFSTKSSRNILHIAPTDTLNGALLESFQVEARKFKILDLFARFIFRILADLSSICEALDLTKPTSEATLEVGLTRKSTFKNFEVRIESGGKKWGIDDEPNLFSYRRCTLSHLGGLLLPLLAWPHLLQSLKCLWMSLLLLVCLKSCTNR
jgi:hypothetical protein